VPEVRHGREGKVNALVGAVTGSTGTQRRGESDFLRRSDADP